MLVTGLASFAIGEALQDLAEITSAVLLLFLAEANRINSSPICLPFTNG